MAAAKPKAAELCITADAFGERKEDPLSIEEQAERRLLERVEILLQNVVVQRGGALPVGSAICYFFLLGLGMVLPCDSIFACIDPATGFAPAMNNEQRG